MAFVSTGGRVPPTDLRTAVLRGLAPDGGLYVPERVPRLSADALEGLRGRSADQVAATVLAPLLSDALEPEQLRRVASTSLDFPFPLVEVNDGTRILELFHGPTGSFKDVGARFLARLLSELRRDDEERMVVLVATSGDTGGAVADAFHGVEGVETLVLYPEGRVSPVQLGQIVGLGGNVRPVAVRGSFDDCQRLLKEALADASLRERVTLTTGNSINLGRFLPQVVYYAHAWSRLDPRPDRLVVSVPSGNLGNLSAGVLAHRMGLPVHRFVAATNANDVAVRYLETGEVRGGPSRTTLSSAMDVARPSNLERLVHFTGGDRERLRRLVAGSAHDDRQTLEAMARLWREDGYLADPHTAVGWLGLDARRSKGAIPGEGIVLSTADPAKFPDVVERATGRLPSPRSDWLDPEEVEERAAAVPRVDPGDGSLAALIQESG